MALPRYIAMLVLVMLTLSIWKTFKADAEQVDSVDVIVSARSKGELSAAFRSLLDECSPEFLSRLKTHPNAGVALQAAWESVRRTLPAEAAMRTDGSPDAVAMDRRQLQRFLGFAEARFRLVLPEWWDNTVATGYAFDRDTLAFSVCERLKPYHRIQVDQDDRVSDVLVSNGWEVSRSNNGDLVVMKAEQSCRIPRRIEDHVKRERPIDAIACCVDEGQCVVAFHAEFGGGYPIFVLDCASSALIWSAEVWGGSPVPGASGRGHTQLVTIVVRNEIVYVFGVTDFGAYIEGFGVADGQSVLRFSTSY